jgi:hypothetical protein
MHLLLEHMGLGRLGQLLYCSRRWREPDGLQAPGGEQQQVESMLHQVGCSMQPQQRVLQLQWPSDPHATCSVLCHVTLTLMILVHSKRFPMHASSRHGQTLGGGHSVVSDTYCSTAHIPAKTSPSLNISILHIWYVIDRSQPAVQTAVWPGCSLSVAISGLSPLGRSVPSGSAGQRSAWWLRSRVSGRAPSQCPRA